MVPFSRDDCMGTQKMLLNHWHFSHFTKLVAKHGAGTKRNITEPAPHFSQYYQVMFGFLPYSLVSKNYMIYFDPIINDQIHHRAPAG